MMTLSEVATATGGQMVGEAGVIADVVTDARAASAGSLFVALRGLRFDGHSFVLQAVERGAVAVITERSPEAGWPPCIVVPDSRAALGQLAAYWRRKLGVRVVAITGSNGKTSVKEMVSEILARVTSGIATVGNLNNDIGMPLTLLRLRPQHRYAVVEIGMNRPGEIATLAAIAAPDIALVTNAGAAHLERLGSVAAVAEEKGQIYRALSSEGVAIINADDAFADYWRGQVVSPLLTFGLDSEADVTAASGFAQNGSQMALRAPAWPGSVDVHLSLLGRHNIMNALAATAVAVAFGAPQAAIVAGLAAVRPVHGRLEGHSGGHGASIIDDTYNANPDSARAALDVLSKMAGERWFVLGDMAELGANSEALHEAFGKAVAGSGINHLWTFGAHARYASDAFGAGGRHYDNVDTLVRDLRGLLHSEAVVLVKGSRSMRMERVVAALLDKGGPDAALPL